MIYEINENEQDRMNKIVRKSTKEIFCGLF